MSSIRFVCTLVLLADGMTLGSAQAVGAVATPGRDGSAMGGSMPGTDHEGMHSGDGMKGMTDSCHAMMGRR
jgi:hypothetical protein